MKVQEDQLVVSKDHTHIMIKGKRTKRQRLPSPLSLAMHSSTSCSSGGRSYSTENSPTNSNIDYRTTQEEEDMANCLILLAQGKSNNNNKSSSGLQLYECKTCNRCFPSFQALGGHRASHKKPKANTIFVNEEHDRYDPTTTTSTILSLQISNNNRPFPLPNLHRSSHTTSSTHATTKLSKVHECSICGAEFSSGQALGGHMRRHRTCVSTYTASATTTSMSSGNIIGGGGGGSLESHEAKKPRNVLKLDLNLPAPDDDHRESKFSFQKRENVIVFSAPSLVDCHYQNSSHPELMCIHCSP